jgi:hypothetical protein
MAEQPGVVGVTRYTRVDTSEWVPGEGPLPGPADRPEVVELARLLPRVAGLAAYVNSDQCHDLDRERLRELVPSSTYFSLLTNLADLRSEPARRQSRAARGIRWRMINLRMFFEDYDSSTSLRS